MSGSFSIALSGLTADTDALDIVGNNLANLNTTGYKNTTASFYDLLAQTAGGGSIQIGGGVSAIFATDASAAIVIGCRNGQNLSDHADPFCGDYRGENLPIGPSSRPEVRGWRLEEHFRPF